MFFEWLNEEPDYWQPLNFIIYYNKAKDNTSCKKQREKYADSGYRVQRFLCEGFLITTINISDQLFESIFNFDNNALCMKKR